MSESGSNYAFVENIDPLRQWFVRMALKYTKYKILSNNQITEGVIKFS
jgi:hypothetical protein